MGTRRSRHNKGRKPLYKEHRRGVSAEYLNLNSSSVASDSPKPARVKPPAEVIAERNKSRRPYTREATGRVINAGFNYLSDLIVRPGIEKRFWPILLYRGQMTRGNAHRLWNFALLMMASEAETLSDGMKLFGNPVFNQLCGPVRPPPKFTLNNFFGRLWDNPDTTDLIPHFTDYVRSLELGPSGLIPVPLETHSARCAEWRISLHPNPQKPWDFRQERGTKQLFYPYMVHNVSRPDDGHDLVKLVNAAVPPTLPEQWRADVCQEMIVAILSGEINRSDVHDHVRRHISKQFKANPTLYGGDGEPNGLRFSLDAPLNGDDERTRHDLLHDGSYEHWSDGGTAPTYEEAWDQADRSLAAREFHQEQLQDRHRFADIMKTHTSASQFDDVYRGQIRDKQHELQMRGKVLYHDEVVDLLEGRDDE